MSVNEVWQPTLSKTQERLNFLYNNEELSDFHFHIGPDKIAVPSHKLILSMTSTYFYNQFKASDTINVLEVLIPNVTKEFFLEFLKYFYKNDLNLNMDNVGIIIKLSKEYEVTLLIDACEEFIRTNLNENFVYQILAVSVDCLFDDLKNFCLEMIGDNSPEIFHIPQFLEISQNLLDIILESELLYCQESDVFQASLKWGKAVCKTDGRDETPENIREILLNSKKLIRFTSMDIWEFVKCIDEFNYLTDEEVGQIFKCITLKEMGESALQSKKRQVWVNIDQTEMKYCKRYTQSNEDYKMGGTTEIILSVNKKIYCCGLSIFGRTMAGLEHGKNENIVIQIVANNIILNKIETTATYNGEKKPTEYFFLKPIPLKPNEDYKISIIRDGPEDIYKNFCGIESVSKISTEGVTFTFRSLDADTNYSLNGPIASILYKNYISIKM